MSGSLVQLVAQGAQDAYITGDPEVSFFKQVYRRHTNFTTKPVKLDIIGAIAPNSEISIKIPRVGDLLSHVWIDLGATGTLGGNAANGLAGLIGAESENGGAIFEWYIGGQMVDRQDAFFMVQLWNKFLLDSGAKAGSIFTQGAPSGTARQDLTRASGNTWLPLHFSFCDGYPLPLVALQYHEVELKIRLADGTAPDKFQVYGNFVLLDTQERQMMTNTTHEFLIHQMQKIQNLGTDTTPRWDLSLLNHPVKALMWGRPDMDGAGAYVTNDVQLYLNGVEVFQSKMPDKYFSLVQPYYNCEHYSPLQAGSDRKSGVALKMYSFAQKANKLQPTGSCNFSRLDTAHMTATTEYYATIQDLYAINYNILKIESGLGGVMFAN